MWVLLILLLISWKCSARLIPYDPETMSYPVSVEQAMQAARDWAGEPVLELELLGVAVPVSEPAASHYYILDTPDGEQQFRVDCYSAEMRIWLDVQGEEQYLAKLDAQWDESTQMPVEDLNAAVADFLAQKYAGFESLNLVHFNPDHPTGFYMQCLPDGVWYPGNKAGCGVDLWSGQVYLYNGLHSAPPTISTVPLVTAGEAEQIALDYAGTLLMYDDDAEDPATTLVNPQSAFVLENPGLMIGEDAPGVQRLPWPLVVVIEVQPGYTADMYYQELNEPPGVATGEEMDISVDAHTGEVFYCEPGGCVGAGPRKLDAARAAKIKSRKPNPSALKTQPRFEKGTLELDGVPYGDLMYPPLDIQGTGYLYAKYLPLLYGGTIGWSSGKAEMMVAGNPVTIRPGSRALIVGGKAVSLHHAPMIVAGRIYVPAEAIKPICGADASWDAEAKVLRITSGGLSVKPQLRRVAPGPFKESPDTSSVE